MRKQILVHNPKGGVGKTVVVALAAEWFLHRGRTVNLIDADGNHSCEDWIRNNLEEGRRSSRRIRRRSRSLTPRELQVAPRRFCAAAI